MVVKTYRAKIDHDAQDLIRLNTPDGRTGYKITKLEVIPELPYGATAEHVLKVYKIEQTSINVSINFSDSMLLGTAIINNDGAGYRYPSNPTIVFDSEVFNQDIYVTHKCADGTTALNYYIELEQVKLTPAQAEVLIVKDLRKQPWTRP